MTRKKRDFTRKILPDPKFNDVIVSKAINILMKGGKKAVAEKALYGALDIVTEKMTGDAIENFHKAIANISPVIEVRSRRVGGATYQVPTEVRPVRAQALALRWLKDHSNSRSERTLKERLAGELMDAINSRGGAIKKKEDTHRMADANKAFAHFRW